ncbi:MAG: ABC transporter substrate-binding protein [Chloroflexota bacterium]
MNKKIFWLTVSGLMALSLVIAACAPAAAPTPPATPTNPNAPATAVTPSTPTAPVAEKQQAGAVAPSSEAPKYGGLLNIALGGDITSHDFFTRSFRPTVTQMNVNDSLAEGDWTQGPAGGYGTGATDWKMGYDVLSLKAGVLAESWKWTADAATNQANLVYQIRRGVRFALNPDNEASRLVNGREMTADDVVYTLNLLITDNRNYIYSNAPELRTANITKTGPWEVTVRTGIDTLMTAFQRFNYWGRVIPREVIAKYGDMSKWQNSVGTGPFIITDSVPGSLAVYKRNPNYWMKDPVGPGKGNQLPYVGGVRYLILPDASTRLAALRTAKIDHMYNVALEDALQFEKTNPQLKEAQRPVFGAAPFGMRTDTPPFNDIRVRRATMMATDFEAIRQGLNAGRGEILTFPWPATKGYEPTYVGLDDSRMPADIKELYTYHPDKAKVLLKEAGYPNGIKVTALMTSTEVDYYSVLKDQWSKAGIDLQFRIVEAGAKTTLLSNSTHPEIVASGVPQARMYYFIVFFLGRDGVSNQSMVNDPKMNEGIARVARTMVTNEPAAMKIWGDELWLYVLSQAYYIPRPVAPSYTFWWPWLKNYSGEIQVGESVGHENNWFKYIWIDQDLKKKMGH